MRVTTIDSMIYRNKMRSCDDHKPIFIVSDKLAGFGIEDSDGKVILDKEYSSISPLGKGIWLISKNGLFGILVLGDDRSNRIRKKDWINDIREIEKEVKATSWEFRVLDMIPCKYDYVYCVDDETVFLCYYNTEKPSDLYFRSTGRLINDAIDCQKVGFRRYFVERRNKESDKYDYIIYNASTEQEMELDEEYYPVSGEFLECESGFYLVCCSIHSNDTIVYRITGNGICKSPVFDSIPTEMKIFEGEGEDEPIFFVGKINDRTIFLDEKLNEIKTFKRLKVGIELIKALLHYSK